MTASLTLDSDGRITLPQAIRSAFGIQPGTPLRAEVTEGRLEIVKDEVADLPLVTEVTEDGVLRLPPGLKISSERIAGAIKADREQRIRKLAGR